MHHCNHCKQEITPSPVAPITVAIGDLIAMKAVVNWARGCDGPDGILEHDIPVIDRWLVEGGLLPPDPGMPPE
jgi:hypothetical protein